MYHHGSLMIFWNEICLEFIYSQYIPAVLVLCHWLAENHTRTQAFGHQYINFFSIPQNMVLFSPECVPQVLSHRPAPTAPLSTKLRPFSLRRWWVPPRKPRGTQSLVVFQPNLGKLRPPLFERTWHSLFTGF